jgi:hypothetical protein
VVTAGYHRIYYDKNNMSMPDCLQKMSYIEMFYVAKKIKLFGKLGEPFSFENEEIAENVFKLLKDKENFKISKNTLWKVRKPQKKPQ